MQCDAAAYELHDANAANAACCCQHMNISEYHYTFCVVDCVLFFATMSRSNANHSTRKAVMTIIRTYVACNMPMI